MKRKKILWITLWTTLAYWLGGAWGCASAPDSNASAEHTEQSTVSTDPPVAEVAVDGELSETQVVAEPGTIKLDQLEAQLAETRPQMLVTKSAIPSLTNGLDRSHWPRVSVGPESGASTHYPIYFRDWHPQRNDDIDLLSLDSLDHQIDMAFADDSYHWWWRENGIDAIVQPLKFGTDILLLPIRAVVTPPWTHLSGAPAAADVSADPTFVQP